MRALLIVLDSVGCGRAPDAAAYGDTGADTLGHLFKAVPGLDLPTLFSLGLWKILTGDVFHPRSQNTRASYGRMREKSAGKDTTTGHWEIAGVLLEKPFATYTAFPPALIDAIQRAAAVTFIGNLPASGTAILERLGPEHLRTGSPILYTSADSVLQIAAHDSILPEKKLHALCRIARRHADAFHIGRVIARPFTGEPGAFTRTAGRHDYSIVPPRTILNAIADTGRHVHSVGKIRDIFAGSGITHSHPTASNAEGMAAIENLWRTAPDDALIFANLVDFDTLHGHRRDPAGYASALIAFDTWLATFLPKIDPGDLLIITADHGNDPTAPGTDHTREEVPLILLHGDQRRPLGTRETFADVAATFADFFRLKSPWPRGKTLLRAKR